MYFAHIVTTRFSTDLRSEEIPMTNVSKKITVPKSFVFKKTQTVGAASAEDDSKYLSQCFVDTGLLSVLEDCDDKRCILVGRTGVGKSALLAQLYTSQDRIIRINLENLSLSYISNSQAIQFYSELKINMELIYRFLWKHIFILEILGKRFDEKDTKDKQLIDIIRFLLPQNKENQKLIEKCKGYFDKYDNTMFWNNIEHKLKEVTTTLENSLKGSFNGKIGSFSLGTEGARKLTEQEKSDVISFLQDVAIKSVHVQDLENVENLIEKLVLLDKQQKYYIVIDNLDENWVEESIRYELIKALIDACKTFSSKKNIKVVIALRVDLLDRVYSLSRGAGFQEEKYRSNHLDVTWNRKDLIELLDNRINHLIKNQYTTQKITHKDVLPPKINKQVTIEYMLDRTLLRPRDIIAFFNACIKVSAGVKAQITQEKLLLAEGQYSQDRFRALLDEWKSIYPNLALISSFLKRKSPYFKLDEITEEYFDNFALGVACKKIEDRDASDIWHIIDVAENKSDYVECLKKMLMIFFKVGLIGIKIHSSEPIIWSHTDGLNISLSDLTTETKVHIQKTFWRYFGVFERDADND